jgi:hypothetical protein
LVPQALVHTIFLSVHTIFLPVHVDIRNFGVEEILVLILGRDTLIYNNIHEDHVKHIAQVFNILKQHKSLLKNPSAHLLSNKCNIWATSLMPRELQMIPRKFK